MSARIGWLRRGWLAVEVEEQLVEIGVARETTSSGSCSAITRSTGPIAPVTCEAMRVPSLAVTVTPSMRGEEARVDRLRETRASTLCGALRRRCSTVSVVTSLPDLMIATRSARRCTSSSSCEERNTVRPSATVSRTSRSNSFCISGSRPEVGSSRMSSSGRCMNASTRPIFWRLPLDSSFAGRSRTTSNRSTSSSANARSPFAARSREPVDVLAPVMRGYSASSPGR